MVAKFAGAWSEGALRYTCHFQDVDEDINVDRETKVLFAPIPLVNPHEADRLSTNLYDILEDLEPRSSYTIHNIVTQPWYGF